MRSSVLIGICILTITSRLVSAFSCSRNDDGLLSAAFGSHYWSCVESTSTNDQLQTCVTELYPEMASVSASCRSCISHVFLLEGAPCIIECRILSDSAQCNRCRDSVATQWFHECVPSFSMNPSVSELLYLTLIAIVHVSSY
jgi:hypothetical protein